MDDDNIIPYQTSPSLTVKQAVMYMLGYRGLVDTELMEFDLSEYLYVLQEEADCAFGNASYELEMLKRNDNASPEAIKNAEHSVESTKAELEKAQKLPDVAQEYRLLINHEISRVRLGKRSPFVVDEDESVHTGQLRINTTSFQEWFEGMELDDANEVSVPIAFPDEEYDFNKELSSKSAESLHVTLGLLVSLFAESGGNNLGSGQKPNVIKIATKIDEYAKQLNYGYPLHGQGYQSIRKRIEVAFSALHSNV